MVAPVLLATVLTCNQVVKISDKMVRNANLTLRQKVEIFMEIKKSIPSCPIYIDPLDAEQPIKLHKK